MLGYLCIFCARLICQSETGERRDCKCGASAGFNHRDALAKGDAA